MSGKGDTPRPVDGPTYRASYDRIFGTATRTLLESFREATELRNAELRYAAMRDAVRFLRDDAA